jgi:hypothetical protein
MSVWAMAVSVEDCLKRNQIEGAIEHGTPIGLKYFLRSATNRAHAWG